MKDRMTLAGIAEASGLPARTIRFYIARGLLDGPLKGGRAAAYTAGHVAQIERIQSLQSEGHTLSEIARILGGSSGEAPVRAATAWWQHEVAEDVVVWVKAGASPWRTKELHAAIEEFARRVQPANHQPSNHESEEG
jgi:DNA-binding transcriptional MerR regulator